MPPSSRSNAALEKKICRAALKLAAKRGWKELTGEEIAKAAKVTSADLRRSFPDKDQILPAIVKEIDYAVIAKTKKIKARGKPHDRLFEIMMARFDALQEERGGILAILEEASRDPALARLLLPQQWQSMGTMLDLADLKPEGLREAMAYTGLMAVYYRALCVWRHDETADMAKTMAALDRALKQAESVAEIIFRTL